MKEKMVDWEFREYLATHSEIMKALKPPHKEGKINMEIEHKIKIAEIAEKIVQGIDAAKVEMAEVLASEMEYAINKKIQEESIKRAKVMNTSFSIHQVVSDGKQYFLCEHCHELFLKGAFK